MFPSSLVHSPLLNSMLLSSKDVPCYMVEYIQQQAVSRKPSDAPIRLCGAIISNGIQLASAETMVSMATLTSDWGGFPRLAAALRQCPNMDKHTVTHCFIVFVWWKVKNRSLSSLYVFWLYDVILNLTLLLIFANYRKHWRWCVKGTFQCGERRGCVRRQHCFFR